VDVRIITPHIPDKKVVFELTRAHYVTLLEAGVQIFEYTPGFIHAKIFAVDDRYGTVGTVNMDYRSMFLHFEDGVVLYETSSVLDIRDDFLATQALSETVSLEQCRAIPWYRRFFRALLRVFAPLL
jgi:cardiolipin synthase